MSSLLDQAIIDAKELREAACKSAEQTILERYAPEVRKAVDSILNSDMLTEEINDVPLAASEGEKLCPCPEEGEKKDIEIDFAELEKKASELGGAEEGSEEDLAMDLGAEDLALQEQLESGDNEEAEDADPLEDLAAKALEAVAALAAEAGAEFENPMNNLAGVALEAESDEEKDEDESEEDEEKDEDEMYDLEEELRVDLVPAKNGWFPPAPSQMKYALDMELARQEADEAKEELEAKKAVLEKLEEKSEKSNKALLVLQERNERYTGVILELEKKINELLLINSRLLFKNRVLESVSLNERQKQNLVETISKARSPEEAKTIFESLKNVVGSVSQNRRAPKSLREATQTPFTGNVTGNRGEPRINDDMKSRMQKLAGISNSNNFENLKEV